MTINKFQGKTEDEAIEKAKKEMGQNAVIMNVREVKPKGFFRAFKKSTFEVTAALEEKEQAPNPVSAMTAPLKMHENINYAADEPIKIPIPKPEEKTELPKAEPVNPFKLPLPTQKPFMNEKEKGIEEKLESLQTLLEKNLNSDEKKKSEEKTDTHSEEKNTERQPEQSQAFRCMKMIYDILLENDVNEKYANQILDDMEKVIRNGSSMDMILSNIYQKMILKFGQPQTIELGEGHPKIVFFIGPTGVGKTTTIAKIASKYKVDRGKKVALLTADTYRIAAAEQLRTYANILDTPLTIIYSPDELNTAIENVSDYDLVLVDTAGFSHKNLTQRADTKLLIDSVDEKYEKEVYLVISATTKYRDLLEIADIYHEIADYKIIFTKLDETTTYGNILNIRLYSGAELSYVTNGQNVPDDIEVFDIQKIVKKLLGGRE